jgi:hypothetical protein
VTILVHDAVQLLFPLEGFLHLEVIVEGDVDADPAKDKRTKGYKTSTVLQEELLVVVVEDPATVGSVCQESKKTRIVLE